MEKYRLKNHKVSLEGSTNLKRLIEFVFGFRFFSL